MHVVQCEVDLLTECFPHHIPARVSTKIDREKQVAASSRRGAVTERGVRVKAGSQYDANSCVALRYGA